MASNNNKSKEAKKQQRQVKAKIAARRFERVVDGLANATSKDNLVQKLSKSIDLTKEFKKDMEELKAMTNHPEWYDKYPLIDANLNWFYPRGYTYQRGLNVSVSGLRTQIILQEPTVCSATNEGQQIPAMTLDPAYKSAIDIIWADARATNAGAINYNSEKMRKYFHNVRMVHSIYYFLQRCITASKHVNVFEKDSPYTIAGIAGLSREQVEDIRVNSANYINNLNYLGHRVNAMLPLPPHMSIMDREKFLFSQVFADRPSAKPAYFGYTIHAYTYYASANSEDVSVALLTDDGGYLSGSFEQLTSQLANLINVTCDDSIWQIVVGDVLKCWGEGAYSKLPYITWKDASLPIVFDEFALDQYKNTITYGYTSKTSNFGWIAYTDIAETEVVPIGDNVTECPSLINSPVDSTDRGRALSLMRNASPYLLIEEEDYIGTVRAVSRFCDGHLFKGCTIFYFDSEGDLNKIKQTTFSNNSGNMEFLVQAGCAPMMVEMNPSSGTAAQGVSQWKYTFAVDLNNYTFVDAYNYEPFQKVAIMSMWKTDKQPVKTSVKRLK